MFYNIPITAGNEPLVLTTVFGVTRVGAEEDKAVARRRDRVGISLAARRTCIKLWGTFCLTTPAKGSIARFSPTVGACLCTFVCTLLG